MTVYANQDLLRIGNIGSFSAAKSSRVSDHIITRSSAVFFMFQYFVLIASNGNYVAFRLAQGLWLALAFFSILYFWKVIAKPSVVFAMFSIVIILAGIGSIFHSFTEIDPTTQPLLKLVSLFAYLWYFDSFRFLGLKYFMSRFAMGAILIVAFSIFHMLASPDLIYGRYLYFGLHPTVGGEILFACFLCIAYASRFPVTVFTAVVVLYLMYLLQARSAIVALLAYLFVIWAGSVNFSKKFLLYAVVITVILLASFVIAFSLDFSVAGITDFFLNDVLLIDDPSRGLGSGLSGRSATWLVGAELFAANPFFGAGIDNGLNAVSGVRVHSGPVLLLAEFGMLSFILFCIIINGLIRLLKQDLVGFAGLVGFLAVFLFQARGLNVNIFPLLMWVFCLPWISQKNYVKKE